MESCMQICSIANDLFGQEIIARKGSVLAAFIRAKSASKRIPAQKSSPRMLDKGTTSQLVCQGPSPHCLVLLTPCKTTQVSSGMHIANTPAQL
jgi:hypothetical protein